ncbi:P1 family peptidase [Pelagivirga sediminicola]|nr:P1 family peptidase [Pelagivirga sediminicola]
MTDPAASALTRVGRFARGALNAIADVAGVAVGHCTLIEGDRTRTGATAILPHGGNLLARKVPTGLAVLNGFGKFVGATQIRELGQIETPIPLAFSTQRAPTHPLDNDAMSPLFEAAIDTAEEATLNSMLHAAPMTGFDAARSAPSQVDALRLR